MIKDNEKKHLLKYGLNQKLGAKKELSKKIKVLKKK